MAPAARQITASAPYRERVREEQGISFPPRSKRFVCGDCSADVLAGKEAWGPGRHHLLYVLSYQISVLHRIRSRFLKLKHPREKPIFRYSPPARHSPQRM